MVETGQFLVGDEVEVTLEVEGLASIVTTRRGIEMKRQRALLAASVAGLIAALGIAGRARQAHADEHGGEASGDTVPCYGINKCQGTGGCSGLGHSCHGQNACEGQGYIELSQDACLRIKDGRLTPEPER